MPARITIATIVEQATTTTAPSITTAITSRAGKMDSITSTTTRSGKTTRTGRLTKQGTGTAIMANNGRTITTTTGIIGNSAKCIRGSGFPGQPSPTLGFATRSLATRIAWGYLDVVVHLRTIIITPMPSGIIYPSVNTCTWSDKNKPRPWERADAFVDRRRSLIQNVGTRTTLSHAKPIVSQTYDFIVTPQSGNSGLPCRPCPSWVVYRLGMKQPFEAEQLCSNVLRFHRTTHAGS